MTARTSEGSGRLGARRKPVRVLERSFVDLRSGDQCLGPEFASHCWGSLKRLLSSAQPSLARTPMKPSGDRTDGPDDCVVAPVGAVWIN